MHESSRSGGIDSIFSVLTDLKYMILPKKSVAADSASVDAYIVKSPKNVQYLLKEIRATISEVVPGALGPDSESGALSILLTSAI